MQGLRLGCSIQMRCELTQSLKVLGGVTQSIFPQVEALLLNNTRYQKALEYVARNKNMNRYRSMIDFLFCELFNRYIFKCFQFYNNNGPMLKDILSVEELAYYNQALLQALEIAYEKFRQNEKNSWTSFRCKILKAIAA